MTNADAAWRTLMDCVTPLPVEDRPLEDSLHRYLAVPVLADRDAPAADRAAMDGYAVRAEDVASPPVTLRIVAEVAAGSPARPHLSPGECVRILTGANVPPDANAVVMREETGPSEGEHVTLLAPVRRGQHILHRGENARRGDVLLEAGARLDASAVALCAAVGCARPRVHALPRIGVISTGSELKAADAAVGDHEIRDSNGPLILATLAEQGFSASESARVPDTREQLRDSIAGAMARNDVTLISGGVSVGKYDFVAEVLRELGAVIRYHGLAIKPGKPQLFATAGAGHYVFGLPGNPLAVLVGLHEFALPALRRLAGCPENACRPLWRLPLRSDVIAKGPRRQFVLGHLACLDAGTAVLPVPNSGSSDLIAGGRADGVILMPEGVWHRPAGAIVDFRPWRMP